MYKKKIFPGMNSIQEAKIRVALHEQILGRDDALRRDLNEEIRARRAYRLNAGASDTARQIRQMKTRLNTMERRGVNKNDRDYRTLLRNYNILKNNRNGKKYMTIGKIFFRAFDFSASLLA